MTMWTCITLLIVVSAASISEIQGLLETRKGEYEEAWKLHVAKFHDGSSTFLADAARFKAFKKTFDYVRSQREQYEAGKASFRTELNFRAAFLPHERLMGHIRPHLSEYQQHLDPQRRKLRNRLVSSPSGRADGTGVLFPSASTTGALSSRVALFPRIASVSPPSSFDWRTLVIRSGARAVGPIQDQGNCSCGWAFAATAATETVNAIATGSFVKLSEQQLVDCYSSTTSSIGCGGGFLGSPFDWVVNRTLLGSGQATWNSYPYKAKKEMCRINGVPGGIITGFGYVTDKSDVGLMAAVAVQPVVLLLPEGTADFQYYSGGILSNIGCGFKHSIVVVGYYTVQGATPVFTASNSWGPSWGERGYLRFVRGLASQSCDLKNFGGTYPTLRSPTVCKSPCKGTKAPSGTP